MQEYQLVERIGKGSFGKVWKALRKQDGKIVALKKIDYHNISRSQKQLIINEINILRKINNDHVVRYLDRINEKDKCVINIIMEYCPGGDLQHLISKTKISGEYIREEQIWLSLGELALALKDCHCAPEKILHRDIKPGNIFIDEEGHVKLGDFGLAKKIDTDYTKTILGTPYYMCPEINKSARYNEECDIWALGCVIYEMAALEPPFRGNSQEMLKRNILYSPVTRFSRKYYSESLWKIVSWMLEKDPKKRPNVKQILEYRNVALTLKLSKVRNELKIIRKKTVELKDKYEKLQLKPDLNEKIDAAIPIHHSENVDNV